MRFDLTYHGTEHPKRWRNYQRQENVPKHHAANIHVFIVRCPGALKGLG